jgi:predicted hydrolase (HD superfamily)
MNRDEAYRLMCEWTQSPNLRKHMLAVEAAMRAYARHFGADEEAWGSGHPFVGVEELRRRGVPEE